MFGTMGKPRPFVMIVDGVRPDHQTVDAISSGQATVEIMDSGTLQLFIHASNARRPCLSLPYIRSETIDMSIVSSSCQP